MRIGTAPRQDIFIDEVKNSQSLPGPGGYEEKSTLKSGNITIGIRREEKLSSVPGPGEYNPEDEKIKLSAGKVKFGTSERTDNFKGKDDAPGPSNYQGDFTSFGQG